jgi:hypothetical protein
VLLAARKNDVPFRQNQDESQIDKKWITKKRCPLNHVGILRLFLDRNYNIKNVLRAKSYLQNLPKLTE